MIEKRKFGIVSTLIILVSVSLFIPYTQLASEFFDPIKNESFEEGSDFQCPPWGTYGGVRVGFLGDVNGDGTIDNSDLSKLEQAFGSDSSKPNWNPDCDIDGNGKVDAQDLFIQSKNYGKRANRLDGTYSWYTSQGGEYYMWQYLDSSTVDSIKGKNVTFSFWFLPESIGSYEEQDNDETHHYGPGYILVSILTIPSYGADQRVHITNVHFDSKVEGGTGYYEITYRKEGEATDTVIVTDQPVTNTGYQTKSHDTDIWGDYGKTVTIRFWTHHDGLGYDIWSRNYHTKYVVPENYARAEIEYMYWDDSFPRSVEVLGDWVYPEEKKWHSVLVTTYLPPSTFSAQVIIHGKSNFKAWIDQTSLSITETKSVEDSYRKFSLAVNLFEARDYDLPIDPCRAFLAISMSADDTFGGTWIQYTELNIKLIAGSFIRIANVTQSNDEDYVTDPDQTEAIENTQIVAAKIAIGATTTASLFVIGPLLGIPDIGRLALSIVTGQGVSLLMSTWRSDADKPYTDELDGYAIARIGYGTSFPDWVNERCKIELGFERGSSCQVEVTGKAEYYTAVGDPPIPVHYKTLERSILVTVSF